MELKIQFIVNVIFLIFFLKNKLLQISVGLCKRHMYVVKLILKALLFN